MIDLQQRLTSIFDYAYTSSAIRVPSATCTEVGKILHVGMFLEESKGQAPAFLFTSSERNQLNGNTGQLATRLAKEVRQTYKEMNEAWGLYKEKLKFTDQDIGFIVGQLSGLEISDPSRDVFGDALEIFRSKWAKQEGGQFFTDQLVTHLAIRMVGFDPAKGDDLVDLCAGTGGFLLAGLNRIKELADARGNKEDTVASLAAKSLKGLEIDEQVASLGNAALISRTGDLASKIIGCANSLDIANIPKIANGIAFDNHLCIATNPPFGAKTPVRDKKLLAQYELSRINGSSEESLVRSGTKFFSRSPDILFLEANVRLLKPGKGRMAIVTPYQVLSGPQTYYARDWLLRHCHIEAVIDLPNETFQPHTGTKTSLLVVRRRKKPLLDARSDSKGQVFMSIPRWIGHDRRGNIVYARGSDGSQLQEKLTDFPEVEKAYFAHLAGDDPSAHHAGSYVADYSTITSDPSLRINALSFRPSREGVRTSSTARPGWETVRLGDVVNRVFYPGRFKREYVDRYPEAVPFLGGSNITEVIANSGKWLRHDDRRLPDLAVQPGWILITRSGTTGIVSCTPEAWGGHAVSEHVIRIVPDAKRLNPFYLLAYLKTSVCQADIQRGVFGSVIDEISPEAISNLMVPVPPPSLQAEIARHAQKAEKARNTAIASLHLAVADLESLLLNS